MRLNSKLFSTSIFFIIFSFTHYGQIDSISVKNKTHYQLIHKKSLALITGYHHNIEKNNFIEIGIGIKKEIIGVPHSTTFTYGISNEIKFGREFIWGLKAGAWFGNGHNLGLNIINYTNFKENSIKIRPEVSLGYGSFRMVYGYHFTITNKNFIGVNTHNLGINIMIDLKTFKREVENKPYLKN